MPNWRCTKVRTRAESRLGNIATRTPLASSPPKQGGFKKSSCFSLVFFPALCTLTGTTLGPTSSRQHGGKLQVRVFLKLLVFKHKPLSRVLFHREDGVKRWSWQHVHRLHGHGEKVTGNGLVNIVLSIVDPRWRDQQPPYLQGGWRKQMDGCEDCHRELHTKLDRFSQSVWRAWKFERADVW